MKSNEHVEAELYPPEEYVQALPAEAQAAVISAIQNRRSNRRNFTDAPIPQRLLDTIVACGAAAPASKNDKPWKFHVVTDRPILTDLAAAVTQAHDIERFVPWDPSTGIPRPTYSSTVTESADVLASATAGIFIENKAPFSGGRHVFANAPETVRDECTIGYGLEMISHGAAIENMWLAARVQGLGCIFMADILVAEGAIKSRLEIVGDLVGVLALGYTE